MFLVLPEILYRLGAITVCLTVCMMFLWSICDDSQTGEEIAPPHGFLLHGELLLCQSVAQLRAREDVMGNNSAALVGTWKLVSCFLEDIETKEQKLVWCEHPPASPTDEYGPSI
jgi:hypothetical protein